ncbi:MAG TPA: DUF2125 domain-containing protein [Hyphomicrobiales bacterium]|nr:DUF2125 domain-containing protein [Hyphomicrobiales bacterium]
MTERREGRRFPWVVLPTIVLVVLIAGWSAWWFHAAGRVGTVIDSWLKRESAAGREVDCADRSVGGFPFEVVVRCRTIAVTVPGDPTPVVARAAGFVGLAQVYDPRHIIVELTGPMQVGAAGKPPVVELSWKLAEASVIGAPDAADQRLSLVIEEPRLAALDAGTRAEVAGAEHLELHARPDPRTAAAVDLVAAATGITAPTIRDRLGGPLDGELQVQATGLSQLPPASLADLLRRFAAAGGQLNVALLRLTAPEMAAEGHGTLALDPDGRPEGDLAVTGRVAPAVLDDLLGREAAAARLGLGLLGEPAVLGGKPATTVHLAVRHGKLTLGPLKLGRLPPLF